MRARVRISCRTVESHVTGARAASALRLGSARGSMVPHAVMSLLRRGVFPAPRCSSAGSYSDFPLVMQENSHARQKTPGQHPAKPFFSCTTVERFAARDLARSPGVATSFHALPRGSGRPVRPHDCCAGNFRRPGRKPLVSVLASPSFPAQPWKGSRRAIWPEARALPRGSVRPHLTINRLCRKNSPASQKTPGQLRGEVSFSCTNGREPATHGARPATNGARSEPQGARPADGRACPAAVALSR